MAKMYELYAIMEGIERDLQYIHENATESQTRRLATTARIIADYDVTPEEAVRIWARKYDKAVYNSPLSRQWREARRKPTPKGDGWDAEHQLGTVKAKTAKKGSSK
jgi:hypothetical protein